MHDLGRGSSSRLSMPHSIYPSNASDHTFTLDDPAPLMSPSSTSKRASGSFGIALTSTPAAHDQRHISPALQKRRSTPIEEAYATLIGGDNQQTLHDLAPRAPGDRRSYRNSTSTSTYNNYSTNRHSLSHQQPSPIYEDQHKYQDGMGVAVREKVLTKQSPVVAELKTNVIIKDEFTLVMDLSYHLAQRYSRPESCIMIKVEHSACLALGGAFDPCYILNISAVPSQMRPTSNKRNASLIQSFLADILSVPADRGIIKFQPVAEECYAMSGSIMLGEVDKFEKQQTDDAAMKRLSNSQNRRSVTNVNPNINNRRSFAGMQNGVVDSPTTTAISSTAPRLELNGLSSEPSSSSDRPSTSHGLSQSADFNGLRMNGISLDQLTGKSARLPNGRPKTLGAEPALMNDSDFRPSLPTSTIASQRAEAPRRSSIKPTPLPSARPVHQLSATSSNDSSSVPRASALKQTPTTASLPAELRSKNTYLDNISSLTKKYEPSSEATPAGSGSGSGAGNSKKDPAANTAKRRSTITATPKLPPIPGLSPTRGDGSNGTRSGGKGGAYDGSLSGGDSKTETKSTKSLKIGKRKSLLSVIRRSMRDDSAVKG